MKTIVSIGRQFGSGGRAIGKKLADALGVAFYDKELIELAAKTSGMSADVIEHVDEKPSSIFNYNFFTNIGNTYVSPMEVPINDKLFLVMTKTINTIANEGCVIVGRCSNYVLRDNQNLLSVFVYADMADRIKKVCETENLNESQAKDMIKKIDKKRASYYSYYTDKKWGNLESYDFMLNSSELGFDKTVELLKEIVLLKEKE